MENKVYEVSYLLLPSLAPEQVPAKATLLKEMLTSAGGTIVSDENPVLLDLAYSMTKVVGTTRHKCTSGYFGWIKFEMPSEGIEAVKKSFDANDEILRYLIINTVRENTLINGKMMLKKDEPIKRLGDNSDSLEIDAEIAEPAIVADEIDKSIDEMVAV